MQSAASHPFMECQRVTMQSAASHPFMECQRVIHASHSIMSLVFQGRVCRFCRKGGVLNLNAV